MKPLVRLLLILCSSNIALAQAVTVVRDRAMLRSEPSWTSETLERLAAPTTFRLIESSPTNHFYHIRSEDNRTGWVWAGNVLFDDVSGPNHIHRPRRFINNYQTLQVAVRRTVGNRLSQIGQAGDDYGNPKTYDVSNCRYYDDLGLDEDQEDTLTSAAITAAMQTDLLRHDLIKLGVPESVWKNDLLSLDDFALRILSGELGEKDPDDPYGIADETDHSIDYEQLLQFDVKSKLLLDLKQYQMSHPQSPNFIRAAECGAGAVEIKIRTMPRGAKVSYIPLFSYNLCAARQIPPDDRHRCHGWIDSVKVYEDLIGKYCFVAVWPDGFERRGIFVIGEKDVVTITR